MILVTGAAGFIGSVLVGELNKIGREDIILVDRLRDGDKWKNIRGLSFEQFVHADSLFSESWKYNFEQIEVIFHMGACSSTTQKNVDYLMKNNVEYSQKLFKLAVEQNIPIIYASSAATYGDGKQGYSDHHESVQHLRPLNPYGYSKQVFDQWVLKQKKTPPFWFGLKFFNVYGPNEYHKGAQRSVVHQAFNQVKEKGKVKLFKSYLPEYKDGEQLRDFIYVKDVAQAMIEMWNAGAAEKSGIYNLGTGAANSFHALATAVFNALELKANIEFIDMPDDVRDQYQYYTQAEMEKFYSLLPHFEFSSLEDGIFNYVIEYLASENPYYC